MLAVDVPSQVQNFTDVRSSPHLSSFFPIVVPQSHQIGSVLHVWSYAALARKTSSPPPTYSKIAREFTLPLWLRMERTAWMSFKPQSLQTNIDLFEYRVTTKLPTLFAPKHLGNSSFSKHSKGSSSVRFSLLVGGGLGNLPLNSKACRSTALTSAWSPQQITTESTNQSAETPCIITSIHFSIFSQLADRMQMRPSLESSTSFSTPSFGTTLPSMKSWVLNFLPNETTLPSSISCSFSIFLMALPFRKGQTLRYPLPTVSKSPLPSKTTLEMDLVMRFLVVASPSSHKNMLPSWLLTVTMYSPLGENTRWSIPNLCPFSVHTLVTNPPFKDDRSSIGQTVAQPCLLLQQTASSFSSGLTSSEDMNYEVCAMQATCSSRMGLQNMMKFPEGQMRQPSACARWLMRQAELPSRPSILRVTLLISMVINSNIPSTLYLKPTSTITLGFNQPSLQIILQTSKPFKVMQKLVRNLLVNNLKIGRMQIRKKIPKGQFKFPDCRYVIIDTDAGGDDTQAIVLAISEAKRTGKVILGVTCVDGNAHIDDVARNVLIATNMAGAPEIPIFKGSRVSLTSPNFKDYYFGKDGFGGKQEGYIKQLKSQNRWKEDTIREGGAIQFLVQSATQYPNELAIIAIGPLTNLALAYHLDNSFAAKVPIVSLMGGSISAFGIRTFFAAEFNFYLDAEAAKIVTDVFPLVCISSFDLSFDLGTIKTLGLFTQQTRPKAKLIHDIHSQILETHRPAVCDPLACIPVFSPELVSSIYKVYGRVEIAGQRTRGTLILDWYEKSGSKGLRQIWAVADIDLESFIKQVDLSYN